MPVCWRTSLEAATDRTTTRSAPLDGVRVLEFGTLVPGPMAGLLLAEAGAAVLKIERPPHGDPLRGYAPRIGADSVQFHALNRGKSTCLVDLKEPAGRAHALSLIARADVLIEQFRPGVMQRLQLDYETVRGINPGIIYCSLTGWGQTGPKARIAGHELNFLAESGHLDRMRGSDGAPVPPSLLVADLAGGAYPAVINILLALIRRDQTGSGAYLDVAISDGLAAFHYDTMVPALTLGCCSADGRDLTAVGSPRYQLYQTADGRYLAVAAVEDRFWSAFCDAIGLPPGLRSPEVPVEVAKAAVAERVRAQDSAAWLQDLAGRDVCCSIVATLQEALADPHLLARGLLSRRVAAGSGTIPTLPLPIAAQFRAETAYASAPELHS